MMIRQLTDLAGRRSIITGAAGGLGQIIAETLAELGSDLILVDLPGTNIDLLKNRLMETYGVSTFGLECDLEKQDQRSILIDNVVNDGREINVLINNAAFVGSSDIPGWGVEFVSQSIETWRRALEVNLIAPFELSQGFSKVMMRSKGATIVNIASIYGQFAPDWRIYESTDLGNPAAYSASKAGLIQFTKWLSTTLAPSVRVNALAPGGVFTGQQDAFVEAYSLRTPLGRMAKYDDFRGIIAFLASDMSNYMTGQIVNVDGGWGVW